MKSKLPLERTVSGVSGRMAVLEGPGLHTGAHGRVVVCAGSGPVCIRQRGRTSPVHALVYDGAARSTTARSNDGCIIVQTIEHLFAALAGLRIHHGVSIEVEGTELPLAGGNASAFVAAIASLEVTPTSASLVVARDGVVEIGRSRYVFSTGREGVSVELDLGDRTWLDARAAWAGDPSDFVTRIASARTFGFEHEIDALLARGLARHVTPESVVVIGNDRALSAGARFEPDEPARHKLLDLIGDLFAHGGPPRGHVHAVRPGHQATHAAISRAKELGLVAVKAGGEECPHVAELG